MAVSFVLNTVARTDRRYYKDFAPTELSFRRLHKQLCELCVQSAAVQLVFRWKWCVATFYLFVDVK
jgi:hypothetical protein